MRSRLSRARKPKAKAKLPRAAKKPRLSSIAYNEAAHPKGWAVSFCALLTLGERNADLGGPWKSRREICAAPAQRRDDGRRHHRRGAWLRAVDQEIPKPDLRGPRRPPQGAACE